MTNTQISIRRRPDGSIDTAFYAAKGRVQRAQQARRLAGDATGRPRRPILVALAALLMIPGFH